MTGEVGRLAQTDIAGWEPAALVSAASAGDEAAWAELVRRYAPLVASVIRSYQLSRADAADVNQTVWLRLVEHLNRLRQPEALAGWLAVTARRECYRLLRLGRRVQPFDPHDDPGPALIAQLTEPVEPEETLLRAERQQALRDGFAQLSPRCQELLALLAAEPPVSYRDISARLGMPVGSVGPTQARCLRKLRACPAIARFADCPLPVRQGGDQRDVMATG